MDGTWKSLKRLCQIIDIGEFIHKVSIPLQVEYDPTLIVLTLPLFKNPTSEESNFIPKIFSNAYDLRLQSYSTP